MCVGYGGFAINPCRWVGAIISLHVVGPLAFNEWSRAFNAIVKSIFLLPNRALPRNNSLNVSCNGLSDLESRDEIRHRRPLPPLCGTYR